MIKFFFIIQPFLLFSSKFLGWMIHLVGLRLLFQLTAVL